LAVQRTLIIVKPDAVQRGLMGTILARFEQRGLRFCALKMMQIGRELAERHYGVHKGKPFYESLVNFITSNPVVVGVVEGPNAIEAVRATMGATDPVKAEAGSIRGQYAIDIEHNLVHGSDSPETAQFEIDLFFRPDEILNYSRDIEQWTGE
jgi:nucleoside-diphosphate kinase